MRQPALAPVATSFLADLQRTAGRGGLRRGMTYEDAAEHAQALVESFEAAMLGGEFIVSVDGAPCLVEEASTNTPAPTHRQEVLL